MRRLSLFLLPVLVILATVDLWVRLHTPMHLPAAHTDAPQALAALSLQQLDSQPLPPLFDLFYTEAGSAKQTASDLAETTDTEANVETVPVTYRLLALRTDADGSKKAILSRQEGPEGTADIVTLAPGEHLGDQQLRAIESHAVLLESPTGEIRHLILFEPAADSPHTDN